jgi:hypothetical protein
VNLGADKPLLLFSIGACLRLINAPCAGQREEKPGHRGFDFFSSFAENGNRKVPMKGFIRGLFALLLISFAFFLGFHLGKEKVKDKIPKFQDDLDKTA